MKQVIITINRDGTSTIDAQNFAGVGCEKATKALEMALVGAQGGSDVDRKKKPDFYASNQSTNTVKR